MSDGKNRLKIKDTVSALEEKVDKLQAVNLALTTQLENMRISMLYLQDKLDAVIAVSERDGAAYLTQKSVEDEIVSLNIEKLKREVQDAVNKGALIKTEDGIVGHRSFIVAKETNKNTGEVDQPRVQVAMPAMPVEVQQDFIGKVVGDVIEKEDNLIEIQEVYDIADIKGKA